MININYQIKPESFTTKLDRFWSLSAEKIRMIIRDYDSSKGSPVYTVNGKYTSRGWTEWTQGFQYGSAILQYDATGDTYFFDSGRKDTIEKMASHVSHTGVHDHGFNNISTYGNLLRLMNENRIPLNAGEKSFFELALRISGAVQASRWTNIREGGGFIYSFNGPHSLFVDTIRSCRILMVSHLLGHTLKGENDASYNLMERAVNHLKTTARYSVYYGKGRDHYDVRGRTAHESVFNVNDGNYRCPNSQQGYSAFTTWTRGLGWAMLGFSEQLELINYLPASELKSTGGKEQLEALMLKAATATCDFYIENTPSDGIPYWDTGAPDLPILGDYLNKPADPYNDFEPVDSSAAAIGAQGLLRLGNYLIQRGEILQARKYWQAGLTILGTLFDEPYLSVQPDHQGLILHSVYHRPNGWDHIPEKRKIPCDESCMWGDYHAREVALYMLRIINSGKYYTFFNGLI
jgi:unsaturated chondroitin disaccharide hydrolase